MVCDKQLVTSKYDYKLSGSTVCSVLFEGTTVFCGNVGDSRAIVCSIDEGKLKSTNLSNDHKPELPEEKARILGMGGRIDSFHDAENNFAPLGP